MLIKRVLAALWRLLGKLLLAFIALQLFFAVRVSCYKFINPSSTAFERSSFYQNVKSGNTAWSQEWVDYAQLSKHIKRAVISSEDGLFVDHDGVYWTALEKAWEKNVAEQRRADAKNKANKQNAKKANTPEAKAAKPKLVGGSTITQQLAKNLFLSGERTYLRKVQELGLVLMLETFLSKQRIYEIYLNHVELGSGIYGIQAGASFYFGKSAASLDAYEAARLAVLLPAPKRYQKSFASSEFQNATAQTLMARMHQVEIP